MLQIEHPEMISSIIVHRSIAAGEVLTLRRWLYGENVVDRADAEALFSIHAVIGSRNSEFNDLFVEALADFIVYQVTPTGRLDAGQADWLIGHIGPDGRVESVVELELLLRVLEEASEVPAHLAAFALDQVKRSVITGEGPAARGRIHPSRVIDVSDVDLISRIMRAAGGHAGRAVSRVEAESLFDIADAARGSGNASAWNGVFVNAIVSHVLGISRNDLAEIADLLATNDTVANAVQGIGADVVEWLSSRILGDGRVSGPERVLLALLPNDAAQRVLAPCAVMADLH